VISDPYFKVTTFFEVEYRKCLKDKVTIAQEDCADWQTDAAFIPPALLSLRQQWKCMLLTATFFQDGGSHDNVSTRAVIRF